MTTDNIFERNHFIFILDMANSLVTLKPTE